MCMCCSYVMLYDVLWEIFVYENALLLLSAEWLELPLCKIQFHMLAKRNTGIPRLMFSQLVR